MAYIGQSPSIGNFQVCDAISVVNGQAAYTMQVSSVNVVPETANHMIVSLNGVIQAPGSSYTVSGSTITFASNLVTGDVIDFIHILGSVLDLGVPSDDTVTAAKISANAVTAAKFNADVISGQTALATEPADTDEFLVSDAGVLKRIDYSLIKGGGQKTLLSTTTLSSTSEVVFNNSLITSTYRDYQITFSNLQMATDGVELYVFFSSDNGSSYPTGNCHRNQFGLIATSDTVQVGTDTGRNDIKLSGIADLGTASGETCSGEMRFYDLLGTDNHKTAIGTTAGDNSSGTGFISVTGGTYRSETAVNTLKVATSSGNMASGVIKFYGIT
nr:hypothetical protein [uncultured Mediterranean phage uvMED]